MIKIVNESILFSLGFLSQNSLWKLSTFCGYKGIYSSVCKECKKSVFIQTGHSGDSVTRVERVASLSRELTTWLDYTFLSCSALAVVTLQLSACFTRVPFWRLASHKIQSRGSFVCTHLKFSSHSHIQPLYNSHLNTRYLIAKIQANLTQNKANT